MRRIGRWILNALTALSLLLCVTTAVLWVRCGYGGDEFLRQGKVWFVAVVSGRDMLSLHVVDISRADIPYDMVRLYYFYPPPMVPGVQSRRLLPGVMWYISDGSPTRIANTTFSKRWDIYLSYWLVTLLVAILPIARLAHQLIRVRMIRRRIATDVCRACSYDLTGNVSGVCPECGIKIAPKAGAV